MEFADGGGGKPPPEWVEFYDDESGAPYYVSSSGETTWERPAILEAQAPSESMVVYGGGGVMV